MTIVALAVAGCSGGSGLRPEIDYKPLLLPVKFTVGPDGIDVAGESTVVTPVGVFSINAKYSLPVRPDGAVHVVIRDRKQGRGGTDSIYLVYAGGGALKAVVNGRTEIEVADGQVTIDVTRGDIKIIQLQQTAPVAVREQPSAVAVWWDGGVRKWNSGYDRSPYKPFMLARWAYDDATVGKGNGLGFAWFLIRLAASIVLIPFDLILTAVFLIAQCAHYFWGPAGPNIIWGLFILMMVGLLGMVVIAIRDA